MNITNIIFAIGAVDTVLILAIGIYAAGLKLAGTDSKIFYERVMPATGILVATSFAAGVVMVITSWLSGG